MKEKKGRTKNLWAFHMCRRVSFETEDTIWEVLSNSSDKMI